MRLEISSVVLLTVVLYFVSRAKKINTILSPHVVIECLQVDAVLLRYDTFHYVCDLMWFDGLWILILAVEAFLFLRSGYKIKRVVDLCHLTSYASKVQCNLRFLRFSLPILPCGEYSVKPKKVTPILAIIGE